MIRMVREINPAVQKSVPSKATDQVAAVGCATCHRGTAIPVVDARLARCAATAPWRRS